MTNKDKTDMWSTISDKTPDESGEFAPARKLQTVAVKVLHPGIEGQLKYLLWHIAQIILSGLSQQTLNRLADKSHVTDCCHFIDCYVLRFEHFVHRYIVKTIY